MNTERMVEYYERNAHWLGPSERTRDIASLMAECPTILDVGTGNGRLLGELQALGRTVQFTGIDCVPAHHAAARVRYPTAEWILDDFMRMDFAGRRFHGVVACSLFTGDGWELADIAPAIQKLISVATRRVVIYNNGCWTPEIRQIIGPLGGIAWPHISDPQSQCFLVDREDVCSPQTA